MLEKSSILRCFFFLGGIGESSDGLEEHTGETDLGEHAAGDTDLDEQGCC